MPRVATDLQIAFKAANLTNAFMLQSKMSDIENVYSSERRNAAPKVVIFRTAATSVLLVGTLTTISQLLSFGYFKVVEIEQVLCFVWQGVLVSF